MSGKKPRGRPLTYTTEIAVKICERLAHGESLRAICRDDGMPPESTVRMWVVDDVQGFAAQYTRARDVGLEVMAEDLIEISDDGRNDWIEKNDPDNPGYDMNGEHIQRSRLRVDTRKWILSKLAPKRYGDRTKVEHSGNLTLGDLVNDDEAE